MKMRGLSGLFFVVCLFCAVIAFPTSDLDGDAEIVVVPLEARLENGDGEIGTDIDEAKDTVHPFFSFAPYNPFKWNFSIFDDFQNMVRQLRERVHNAWSELPVAAGADSEKDPNVKSNSTSRVEYIDGRKVVINDTIYTKETDFGSSVYKVRVIDFLPLDDETISTASDGQSGLDVENIDNKTEVKPDGDSEIEKGSPEELDNNDNENEINRDIDEVENFELDDDNNQQQQLQNHHQHHQHVQQQEQQEQHQQPLLEEQNYTNNRLEEFMPNNSPTPTSEHSWESIEDENENVNENINMSEHYPVDLSNDIAINQMAADQGVPYDSDAEIFSLNEYVQYPISTTYEFVPVDIKK